MLKKTLIGLGLLVATTLSGCVVAVPRPGVVYGPACGPGYYDSAVVVAPVPVPVPFGFWGGGWYGHGYWHGGYYGRHWR